MLYQRFFRLSIKFERFGPTFADVPVCVFFNVGNSLHWIYDACVLFGNVLCALPISDGCAINPFLSSS